MNDDTDRFWEELRKQTGDPKCFTALTDEEAERRMAEAGEEPMSGEEIDEIVRSATAQGPQGVVHRDIEKPQARYLLKAAAAVMLTVVLVAGVVTTKAVLWPERSEPTMTLAYRDAILIVLDGRENEKARNDSLVRIGTSTRLGIRGLQRLHGGVGQLRQTADSVLRMLRETLHGPRVFEEGDLARVHALRHPVGTSMKYIGDASNRLPDRLGRQRDLGDQLQLGILALKKVRAMEEAGTLLHSTSGSLLRTLRAQLKP